MLRTCVGAQRVVSDGVGGWQGGRVADGLL
jgi:hypothetical protein